MEFQQQPTDVVVIGGGMAGLSAAAYLARAGISVTVFEKAAKLGGRAESQEIDGFIFNRGIHALYSGGPTEAVLKELGVHYSAGQPQHVSLMKEGKLHVAPIDPATLLRSTAFNLADKIEFMRMFTTLPNIDPHTLANVSIEDWIAGYLHRPAVRQYLTAFGWTFAYSSALDVVSADMFVNKLQISFRHPVLYIDGGWQTLVEGLRQAAIDAGAKIVTHERVEAVEYEAGHVTGVRLRDGQRLPANAVVIATAPKDAVKLVDGGSYPALRQIVDSLVPAQVACLDVALSRLPDPSHPIVQDLEHPRFMTTQSQFSRIAPEGGALIYSFKQLDPRRMSDPRDDERDLEAFLDSIQPGWRDLVVKRFFLPRIDAVGALPTVASGGLNGRPSPQVPGIANLYLAGDWIGPDSFLSDPSTSSARQVARLIQESLPVGAAV